MFSLEVLDLTEEGLMKMFATGVSQFTSLSLAILYPTPVFTFQPHLHDFGLHGHLPSPFSQSILACMSPKPIFEKSSFHMI